MEWGLFLMLVTAAAGSLRPDSEDWLVQTRSLLDSLEDLFVGGNRSDLTLRVQTPDQDQLVILPVHCLILTMHSPVLGHMIRTRKSDTLDLTETPETAKVFSKFIRYLYSGELPLRLEEALPLHRLASKYNVSSLRRSLTDHMTLSLASDWPPGLVTSWYEYAVQMNDVALRDHCLRSVSWNLSWLLASGEFAGMSSQLLAALLPRSDLVLKSELDLFSAVESWIARNDPDGLTAENALRAVRYAMIPPSDLFRIQTESAVLERYRESVRDLLFLSFQFHSSSPVKMARFFDVNCTLFVPRNYLGPDWGSAWAVPTPTRDDRSTSFQTQLAPSGSDQTRRITWNLLFSPRWLPVSARPGLSETSPERVRTLVRPRIAVSPATTGPELAGIVFQKTLLVLARSNNQEQVLRVCSFHQSSEESPDCLRNQDLNQDSLRVHIIVRPVYHRLD